MKNKIKEFFTITKTESVNIARILWVVTVIIFLGLAIFSVVTTGMFGFTDFSIATATILGIGWGWSKSRKR